MCIFQYGYTSFVFGNFRCICLIFKHKNTASYSTITVFMMHRNVIMSELLALIQVTFRPMITNLKMMTRNIWWRYSIKVWSSYSNQCYCNTVKKPVSWPFGDLNNRISVLALVLISASPLRPACKYKHFIHSLNRLKGSKLSRALVVNF